MAISRKELWLEMYTMTQEERTNYICNTLSEMDIPFKEYNGNIYSIRYENEPMFVAHLDTVKDADMSKSLYLDPIKNALYREGGILGADDIAGCAIIMNHAENINFVFFRDEEIGGLGSAEMSRNNRFIKDVNDNNITCFIELDRMNSSDIIGSQNGYCDTDLDEAVANILGYKLATGVWTDIDNIKEIKPGVNLSVGYYRQHSASEYLMIDEFMYINGKIMDLKNGLKNEFKPAPEDYFYNAYRNYFTNYKWTSSPKLDVHMIDFLELKYGLIREDIQMLGYDFFDSEGMLDEYYVLTEDNHNDDDMNVAYGYLDRWW